MLILSVKYYRPRLVLVLPKVPVARLFRLVFVLRFVNDAVGFVLVLGDINFGGSLVFIITYVDNAGGCITAQSDKRHQDFPDQLVGSHRISSSN